MADIFVIGAIVIFSHHQGLEVSLGQKSLEVESAKKDVDESQRKYDELFAEQRRMAGERDRTRKLLADTKEKLEKDQLELAGLRNRLRSLKSEKMHIETSFRKLRDAKEKLPKQLIGLQGNLRRVVFLVDCSGSMNRKVVPTSGDEQLEDPSRWEYVKSTIETWMAVLPMDEAAIIFFGDSASTFPLNEGFAELASERENLIEAIKVRPTPKRESTNTLLAIQKAFSFEQVDTIILFTDGEPTLSPTPSGVQILQSDLLEENREIYEEKKKSRAKEYWSQIHNFIASKENPKAIPINVVALGDYFDNSYGPNLIRLSESTGGTFMGRGGVVSTRNEK